MGFLLAAQSPDEVEVIAVREALFVSPRPLDGSLAPWYRVRDMAAVVAVRALDAVLDIEAVAVGNEAWVVPSMAW